MTSAKPVILVAEDIETDAFILKLAFEKAGVDNPIVVVKDGQEVVEYLTGTTLWDNRAAFPLPGILILDLKMPRLNGFDVLQWIAGRPAHQGMPVVMFSSSSDESDIRRSKELGAKDYFVKPHDFEDYVKFAKGIVSRWLSGTR